ncbi:hypothetical protein BGX24_000999 [Mortierella sp. AD032]|nr:hypothetical protein BGX24_000999 [Mortierella sp. AD032]
MMNPFEHHVVGYSTSESAVMSVSSGKSLRLRIRKRVPAFFKDVEVLAVSSAFPMKPADAAVTTVTVPIIQDQTSPTTPASLYQDIFPKNVGPATLTTTLPKPYAHIEQTTQLVY